MSPQREANVAYAYAATPVWPGGSARPYSYREALGRLREFEGWRCLWRVAAGGALLALVPLLAIGGFVAGVYVAGDLHSLGRVVLGAVIALGPGQLLSLWIWQRRPWDRLVAERLWTYEKRDGPGDLNASIQPEDFLPASRALRRAKLCPCGGTHMPTSPPGAEGLTLKLIVGRPARWHMGPVLHSASRERSSAPAIASCEQLFERSRACGTTARGTSWRASRRLCHRRHTLQRSGDERFL